MKRPIVFAAICVAGLLTAEVSQTMANDSSGALAPRPYTAGQIRDFSIGLTTVYRVEQGDQVVLSETQFLSGDETSGKLIARTLDADGNAVGEPTTAEVSWIELRDHASFPEATSRVTDASCETPVGTFECWLYTITSDKGIQRFYFAKERPGAPVLFEAEADGKITYRNILIEEHRSAKG